MKKMTILFLFISIVFFLLASVNIFGYYKGSFIKPSVTGEYYPVKGKLFGEDADIREFITPYAFSVFNEAQRFKTDNDIVSTIKVYNWLEENYVYTLDKMVIINNGKIVVNGGADSWNLPVITLAEKHQNGGLEGDCEDGTFLLVSMLRAIGINAYANVGIVNIGDSMYGHAWATVAINNKEYLLETTLGESVSELRPVPSFYTTYVKFNEKDVFVLTHGDINSDVTPPLPPAKIQELKNLLKSSS